MIHFMKNAPSILVASTDPMLTRSLEAEVSEWGYSVLVARDSNELYQHMNHSDPLLVMLDVSDGDATFPVLTKLTQGWKATPVVAVSADLTISKAVKLTKMGAYDVSETPPLTNELRETVRGISKLHGQKSGHHRMKAHSESARGTQPYQILGKSQAVMDVLDLVQDVAETNATVLILGESGTGKELLARAIHHSSLRSKNTFVPVNVAALPPNIAESILFGHEKGAYTGADAATKGWCETANGGTLMLDEIGEMDILLQAKLLRFLQDGTFMRVGANKQQHADVRVIAATNRDPGEMVQEHRLREDLYYRLNVFPIRMPPLRDRREDIPILADTFLKRSAELHRRQVIGFTEDAMSCLVNYDWPGNIRQLENLVTRMVLLNRESYISVSHVPIEIKEAQAAYRNTEPCISQMQHVERQAIVSALEKTDGNAVAAAKLLGVGQATIYRKIKRFDIQLSRIKSDSKLS